jgi:hypothetical protein
VKYFIIFLILIFNIFGLEKYAYFSEPKGYEIVNPKAYTKCIKIGFIKKKLNSFSDSINLATQITSLTLNEYIKEVEKTINQDNNSKWEKIGFLKTKNLNIYLAKIEKNTKFGKVKMLQMYYLENEIAYVLTLASLKEDFLNNLKEFNSVIDSFRLTDDIFLCVEKDRDYFKDLYFQTLNNLKDKDKKTTHKELKNFEKKLNQKKISTHLKYLLIEDLSKKILKNV